jgi:hypothetical protein
MARITKKRKAAIAVRKKVEMEQKKRTMADAQREFDRLRDSFAMAALNGLIVRGSDVADDYEFMVKNAWRFAELMVEYRGWKAADDEADEVLVIGQTMTDHEDEVGE